MYSRMQRLDPAVENLGKRGEFGNIAHRNFLFSQQVSCSARRNDVYALALESARKRSDASFVGNGNERAGDFHGSVTSRFGKSLHRFTNHEVRFTLPRQRSRITFFAAG